MQYRFLEALGVSVPCKRNFQVCNFFVLKIGPDSGIFNQRNIGGKNSLRHELPHTRNLGSVLATVHPVDSFWRLTSKLPRDFGLERFLRFFSIVFITLFFQYSSSVTSIRSFLLLNGTASFF